MIAINRFGDEAFDDADDCFDDLEISEEAAEKIIEFSGIMGSAMEDIAARIALARQDKTICERDADDAISTVRAMMFSGASGIRDATAKVMSESKCAELAPPAFVPAARVPRDFHRPNISMTAGSLFTLLLAAFAVGLATHATMAYFD
jgi:hypothetical protein